MPNHPSGDSGSPNLNPSKHPIRSCLQPYVPPFFQFMKNQSEDCLVLNIWTPNAGNNNTNKSQLKPIMFWLHGGGLSMGSIYEFPNYNGTALATHDVMVVTVNYRLGPFGFLYAGDETAPGNAGLYDQLLALKWVRENAEQFGGDRDRITIFGESAGSQSVSALVLSPLAKGLFRRAIHESGVLLTNKKRPYISKTEALDQFKVMANHFNCGSDRNRWLQCLRNVSDYEELIKTFPMNTCPALESTELLPEINAQNAFIKNNFNQGLDIMVGVSRNEGSLVSRAAFNWMFARDINETDFDVLMDQLNNRFKDIDIPAVKDYYLK
ncbi:unnamed protein product, partial [Medioppia subpectinata]